MLDTIAKPLREQMPITNTWAYFDHAAVAPIPQSSFDAIEQWNRDLLLHGCAHWPNGMRQLEALRRNVADSLHCSGEEIGLIHNTTAGINLVAEGIPWAEGDNIVTLAGEFPTNIYPWMNLENKGVELRVVETDGVSVDLDSIREACDPKTRLISVSWVEFMSGWRNDINSIGEIAHEFGAWFFLDAIQGFGMFPLDLSDSPVDFLAADGHKWLLGPEGAGIFYIRKNLLDQISPTGIGWNSVKKPYDFHQYQFDLKDSAARFEGGTYNMAGFVGLNASWDFLNQLSTKEREAQLRRVTDYLVESLERIDFSVVSDRTDQHWSGIIAAEFGELPVHEIKKACKSKKVFINHRGDWLRFSPHLYTNASDIDRLIDILQTFK